MALLIIFYSLILFGSVNCYDGLEAVDLRVLEQKNYCQIKSTLPEDFDLQFPEINYYISFNGVACEPYIEILDFESLLTNYQECHVQGKFIKNPNVTYLFLTKDQEALSKLNQDLFNSFQCSFKEQPYFFLAISNTSSLSLYEAQVYCQHVEKVAAFTNKSNDWILDESTFQSVEERRSNFHGEMVKIHYDYYKDKNLKGYSGLLGSLIAKKFNVTYNKTMIKQFGAKLPNGTFTGTVGDIIHNRIDIGKCSTPAL